VRTGGSAGHDDVCPFTADGQALAEGALTRRLFDPDLRVRRARLAYSSFIHGPWL